MTDSVAKRTPEAQALVDSTAKGRALMSGTKGMREQGKLYLPQFPIEAPDAYRARLESSFLFEAFEKTVSDMTGRVFSKSVEIEKGELADEEQNIDMQGRDLSSFARDVFEAALGGCGLSFIMVDTPRRDSTVTKAQAQAENLRPYFVHIKVEEVLGWQTAANGSKTVLSMFRVLETVEEDDPKGDEFTTVRVDQVRVLSLAESGKVLVRIYREDKDSKWALYGEPFESEATEITVVPFYANRQGHFKAKPPLRGLADKNIEHWQSASDQRNILHSARVPILFGSGRDDEEKLVISAGMAVTARDPDAKLAWVEHSGKAIEAGRQDMEDIKLEMQVMGLQLLVAGTETATGASLDAAKETAPLAMMADNLKDALEQALRWFTMYQGSEREITVQVNKDFGVVPMTAQEALAMQKDVQLGYLSKEEYYEERKRRGVLRSDLSVEKDMERIDDAAPVLEGEALDLTNGG